MLFIHSYRNDFFNFFCFPNITMNVLNIASALKIMTVKELKDFIFENY